MKKLLIGLSIVVIASISINGCSDAKEKPRTFQGLIGAYFGNDDFTRIKESEILTKLEQVWDEETGHGGSWSGEWEGMLKIPVRQEITFTLKANKWTELHLGNETISTGDGDNQTSKLTIPMETDKVLPIRIRYSHSGGGEGGFRIMWEWQGKSAEVIPIESVNFTVEQALAWNWIPEPDPDRIDYSKFVRPQSEHVIVYDEPGRFCGWPANNGLWQWENEILVGFTLAYYQEKEHHHSVDESKPSLSVFARSLDGGMTWIMEDPEGYAGDGGEPANLKQKINFTHPDLVIRCTGQTFYYSYDRGKTWAGPFLFPDFGREKITSRTDYIVNNADDCLFFLSTREDSVQSNMQDRAFCAQTSDGGMTFTFLSWIGEPITVRSVMPSTVRISDSHLVSALRRRVDEHFENKPRLPRNWIDLYQSEDNGKTWQFLSKAADTDMRKNNGNPPSLIRLADGRMVVTWGYRAVPYGIQARISPDNGKTWGEVIHLRDDARTFDFGYTRSVQRPDGKIVTIYYYTTEENHEQYIAATIWDPDEMM